MRVFHINTLGVYLLSSVIIIVSIHAHTRTHTHAHARVSHAPSKFMFLVPFGNLRNLPARFSSVNLYNIRE